MEKYGDTLLLRIQKWIKNIRIHQLNNPKQLKHLKALQNIVEEVTPILQSKLIPLLKNEILEKMRYQEYEDPNKPLLPLLFSVEALSNIHRHILEPLPSDLKSEIISILKDKIQQDLKDKYIVNSFYLLRDYEKVIQELGIVVDTEISQQIESKFQEFIEQEDNLDTLINVISSSSDTLKNLLLNNEAIRTSFEKKFNESLKRFYSKDVWHALSLLKYLNQAKKVEGEIAIWDKLNLDYKEVFKHAIFHPQIAGLLLAKNNSSLFDSMKEVFHEFDALFNDEEKNEIQQLWSNWKGSWKDKDRKYEVEVRLKDAPNGSWMVRMSDRDPTLFVLSFKNKDQIQHLPLSNKESVTEWHKNIKEYNNRQSPEDHVKFPRDLYSGISTNENEQEKAKLQEMNKKIRKKFQPTLTGGTDEL